MERIDLVEKNPKYRNSEFINYVKKNYQDLREGKTHCSCLCLSCIYHACIKRGERFRKYPFFIYWLWTEVNNFWTADNIEKIIKGQQKFLSSNLEKGWDKVDYVIEKLYDKNPKSIFHFPEINEPQKIRYRYWKRAIIEKNLVDLFYEKFGFLMLQLSFDIKESLSDLRNSIFKFASDLRDPRVVRNAELTELKNDVLEFLKTERYSILSDIRRYNRRFQRIDLEIFKKIIYELEDEGRISIKVYSGRTFLNWQG